MYLTRIYLNPHRRGAKQLMRSRQMLHAAVLNCFPPGVLDDPGAPRVLWRLDRPPTVRGAAPRQGSPSCALYISSPVAPDPSHIVEEAGYATEGGVFIRDMSTFLEGLSAGQRWGFRLCVNPTFGGVRSMRGDARRFSHTSTQDRQTQWVLERAEKCGFRVLTSAELGGDLPVLEDSVGNASTGRIC